MSGHEDDVDTYDLADLGDDRPGLEDLADDDLEVEVEDDDTDDDDDLEDAGEDDVDFIAALYREDGEVVASRLPIDLANDLDELITELRRYPADGGALGIVSVSQEFFVLTRVRGNHVQVLLSDAVAAGDWPIARDVADYLGEDVPEDDEPTPMGDLGMLADLGCSEFDLEQFCLNYDDPADEVALAVADKIRMGDQLRKAID